MPPGVLRDHRPGVHVLWLASRVTHPFQWVPCTPFLSPVWDGASILFSCLQAPLLGGLDVWPPCCPETCPFDHPPPPAACQELQVQPVPLGFPEYRETPAFHPPCQPQEARGRLSQESSGSPSPWAKSEERKHPGFSWCRWGHGNHSTAPLRKPSSSPEFISSLIPPGSPAWVAVGTWI